MSAKGLKSLLFSLIFILRKRDAKRLRRGKGHILARYAADHRFLTPFIISFLLLNPLLSQPQAGTTSAPFLSQFPALLLAAPLMPWLQVSNAGFSLSLSQASGQNQSVSVVDVDKIQKELSLKFRILKTQALGYMPLHKFYWVSLNEKVAPEKIELLARRIIEETISKQPRTFHSITIHFFWEADLKERVELSPSFARATFLPFGDWQRVVRVPLGDYKDYKLTVTFIEKKDFLL